MNKKGFTLIELLAVIVVLAIVLVVTIPSVLSSMEQAKKKQFENAIATVEEYMQKQIEACKVGDADLTGFDSSLFENGSCKLKKVIPPDSNNGPTYMYKIIANKAGYSCCGSSDDFGGFSFNSSTGKITDAVSGGPNSKFGNQSYSGK